MANACAFQIFMEFSFASHFQRITIPDTLPEWRNSIRRTLLNVSFSTLGLGRDVLLFRKLIIIFGKRLWATIGCLDVAIKCCMMAIGICLMKARICTICGPKLAEFTLRGQFWFCFCFANCFFDLYLIVFLILFQFLKIRTIFLLAIIINI